MHARSVRPFCEITPLTPLLQDWVMRSLPEGLLRSYILSTHADLRRRFLKKALAAASTAAVDAAPVASGGSSRRKEDKKGE
jgi:hypothetical protein